MLRKEPIYINGDGTTSRDFCYVDNAVQANLLAATAYHRETAADATNEVYNVAAGGRTTLNMLFALIRDTLASHSIPANLEPIYRNFRAGDVLHSQADIGKAQSLLGYSPSHTLATGLPIALPWYVALSALR